jgi:hypothetical protein
MGSLLSRLATLFILLFSGCAIKNGVTSTPTVATFKTPTFKFNSTAFIKQTSFYTALDLYSGVAPLGEIKINATRSCIDQRCFKKREFNYQFLSQYYPDTLLENVLNSQPIYDGLNLNRYNNGFSQFLQSPQVDISYKVDQNRIYFRDKKNGILIKIRRIEQ